MLVGLPAIMNITAWKSDFLQSAASQTSRINPKQSQNPKNFHLLFVRKLAVSQVHLILTL